MRDVRVKILKPAECRLLEQRTDKRDVSHVTLSRPECPPVLLSLSLSLVNLAIIIYI